MAKKNPAETTDAEQPKPRRRGRPPKPVELDADGNPIPKASKVVRHPIPEGWNTPAEFLAYINYHEISDASQQAVYAWTRGAKEHTVSVKDKEGNVTGTKTIEANGFPCVVHSDERVIVHVENAIQWIKEHEEAKRNRVAAAQNRELNASTRMRTSLCRLTNLLFANAIMQAPTASDTED